LGIAIDKGQRELSLTVHLKRNHVSNVWIFGSRQDRGNVTLITSTRL
jgi:hypothetical protein